MCFKVFGTLVWLPVWIACYADGVIGRLRSRVTFAVRDFDEMERFGPS